MDMAPYDTSKLDRNRGHGLRVFKLREGPEILGAGTDVATRHSSSGAAPNTGEPLHQVKVACMAPASVPDRDRCSGLQVGRRTRPGVAHDSAFSPVSAVASLLPVRTPTLANAGAESAEVRKASIHAGLQPTASAESSAGSAGSAVHPSRATSAGIRAARPMLHSSSLGDVRMLEYGAKIHPQQPPHRAG